MITKEEFEKVVKVCTSTGFTVSCENCPLSEKDLMCGVYLAEYIKNEPAPAATGTSSEVSKDTGSILQFDDSTKSIFVKHTKLLMKLVQICSLSTKECRNVSREPLI